ncbi:hypothetical protein DM860_005534 [Cuscuta australis]|uniref:Uncharacterized protein n=1 Tax=Cuscuta australis TaxID=267555 RepID=A0A328E3D7_9ASTE|nr:hypothetical protein DM860_005534 [Cuscuta australis]
MEIWTDLTYFFIIAGVPVNERQEELQMAPTTLVQRLTCLGQNWGFHRTMLIEVAGLAAPPMVAAWRL